jgi:hypothetical protein
VWSQRLTRALRPLSRNRKQSADLGCEMTMACLTKGSEPSRHARSRHPPSHPDRRRHRRACLPCPAHDHATHERDTILNLGRYTKILWIALVVNAAMFLVEVSARLQAGSLSLMANEVDFAGDAMNYAV